MCDLCGSGRTTTNHDVWYVHGSDLQPGATGPVSLRKRGVSICLDCKSKEIDRFRRLAKKTPFTVGTVVAVISAIGVTIAMLVFDKTQPGLGPVLVGGSLVGATAGMLIGVMVYFWLLVRVAPHNIVQGLVVSNAERLGLAGCFGFWLKEPLSFDYGGRTYTVMR
jgi:hypothetical protein